MAPAVSPYIGPRSGPYRFHPPRAAAFTLIELLVVVSIIALLPAVLIPSLSRAPSAGRTVAYLENAGLYAFATSLSSEQADSPFRHYDGRPIRGWHRRNWVFNVAFVDGHCAEATMNGIIWPPPVLPHYPLLREDADGGYRAYRMVTWRGSDWQIDCLPAFPAAVLLRCTDPSQDREIQ